MHCMCVETDGGLRCGQAAAAAPVLAAQAGGEREAGGAAGGGSAGRRPRRRLGADLIQGVGEGSGPTVQGVRLPYQMFSQLDVK